MNASRKWLVVCSVAVFVFAALIPNLAEARGKGGSSKSSSGRGYYSRSYGGSGYVNTPFGRMRGYRPALQTPAQF